MLDRRTFLLHAQHASAALALGGTVAGWSASAWGQSGPPASEAKAPPLPEPGAVLKVPGVQLLNGAHFQPVAGKPLLLYWWASTCPFCALQSPEMQKLWHKLGGQGLQMLGLSVDRKAEDAVTYLHKRGYTFPSAWVTPAFQAALPKPKGLPITLVLDGKGQVLQAEKGQLFAEDVEQLARWWT
jgi:peroxiredoxin